MLNSSITNEKLMENISLKSVNLIPSLAYGKVIQNYDEKYPKKVKKSGGFGRFFRFFLFTFRGGSAIL